MSVAILAILLSLSSESEYPCTMGMTISGDSSGTTQTAELDDIGSYKTAYLTGSICPPTSGNYTLYCEGLNSVEITFNGTTKGDAETVRCLGTSTSGNVTAYLYAHYCYPFSMYYSTGCALYTHYADLYITPPGGSEAILNSSYTTECEWSNCLLDYYGSTCSNYCDVYCNGNGYCSNGTSGTGLCVCSSFSSDPFCENTSYYRFSSASGLYLITYDTENFSGDSSTTVLQNSYVTELTLAYQSIEIVGYLYMPENGYYDLEVISTVPALFTVNATSYGSIQDMNLCNTTATTYTTSIGTTFFSRGTTYFKMTARSGCPLLDHNFSLYWKFYRYYSNSASTPWEIFPSRYLTYSA